MVTRSASTIPLKMVICDDDAAFNERLARSLIAYCGEHGFLPEISKFTSGYELLASDLRETHILFLDVRLADTYGIDVAQELKRRRASYKLIFVTELLTADHRAVEVAFRYLPKAHLETTLESYVTDAIEELGLVRTPIQIKMGRLDGRENWETLYLDEIVYINVNDHTCTFHILSNKNIPITRKTSNYSLSQLERELPPDEFLRVSKKHLVNINAIVNMANYTAHLVTGELIKVSEKSFDKIRRQYFEIKGSRGIK